MRLTCLEAHPSPSAICPLRVKHVRLTDSSREDRLFLCLPRKWNASMATYLAAVVNEQVRPQMSGWLNELLRTMVIIPSVDGLHCQQINQHTSKAQWMCEHFTLWSDSKTLDPHHDWILTDNLNKPVTLKWRSVVHIAALNKVILLLMGKKEGTMR